jgi:cobalt-zinc-cadmium efflux system outer membrane protein
LTLDAARSQAANANPDILAARGLLSGANAGVTIAGERPNPTLNLLANQYDPRGSANVGGVSHTPIFASAQLTQTFERGNKRGARLAVAHAGVEAATADLADAQRRSDAAVRAAYFDLKFALAKRDSLREVADLQQQTLGAADRRLKAGDLSAADRTRIELEATKAQNDVVLAEADAVQARIALASLMGCAATAALDPVDAWPEQAALSSTSADAGSRADERAAAARAQAASAALAVAKAEQHRDVTLGLEYDHDPRVAPHMAGISVSVPLFLAHHFEGEVAQAVAQRDSAEQTASSTRLLADAERLGATQALAAAEDHRRRSVEQVLPQAEKAAEAVEYAYAHGASPLLDLLDARRTLRAARLDALSAQNDYAHALANRDAALLSYSPPAAIATAPAR